MGYHSPHPLKFPSPQPLKSCLLYSANYFLFFFRFAVLGFRPVSFSFFSPILHLNPCWGDSNINRLRVHQRLVVGCGQSIHYLGKQTGTSHSRDSHRNILPVSGRPKILALESYQWPRPAENREIIQDRLRLVVQGKGEHTYHLSWSLNSTCHERSRNYRPCFC